MPTGFVLPGTLSWHSHHINKQLTDLLAVLPCTLDTGHPHFTTLGGMWVTVAVRCQKKGAPPFSLDMAPEYGTDQRLNDRYALCDHG